MDKPDDATFADAYLTALQFLKHIFPIKLFCTDLTLIGPLTRTQELWLSQECYKKSYNVLQDDFFVAVVFSEDHFKAVVFNYVLPETAYAHEFVHFNYFTCQNEALHWLASINEGQDTALMPRIPGLL
ncbi:hypothetical protein [Pontibacter russatus]|uniref:hypothetical protein n=1 Tax=Pontibacter russatus TaxID=2694929 RepID=UPI00137B937B|nr:hypothetical protein [Pontibacter russatus]